jgi:tRNA-uridine 2-sulfurtransferase
MTAGPIVDSDGNQIGEHEGAQAYTVGQRRGLKLGRPAPDGKPRFVLEIRPKENTVVAGSQELLDIDLITGIRLSWAGPPVAETVTGKWFGIELQIRAHADPVPARARVEGQEAEPQLVVELMEPLKGVAPGQTAVMYQGTRVLGQATIDTARSHNYQPV